MAGRRYEQALSRALGPGERLALLRIDHSSLIMKTAELYAVEERGEIRYAGVSNNAHARATCLAYSL